ncbi:hypothetical protein PAECIP111891_04319 [Paenibacillus allorhizoplanae]|uniref:Uncharacterized protein n=1 Tax=Paenibacillus allorhizoplanae TaxID=2905648 RepID=A0ABN8GRB8_9BACL|nr:hypothetical protein [Paenibacillus allorhizoplanae]CAH1215821.1 hypothetical protein PAECIP111891_04319 [Paenibacillus allorhizoplanae]
MQIKLKDEWFILGNNKESVDLLFEQLDELKKNENVMVSTVYVNEEEIFGDFYDYIVSNINQINKVEFKVISHKEYIIDLIKSVGEYLEGALPEANKLPQQFYTNPTDQAWASMVHLFEGMEFILKTFDVFTNHYPNHASRQQYEGYIHTIINEISNLEHAMNDVDYILTADLLKYEILPALKGLRIIAETIINPEESQL